MNKDILINRLRNIELMIMANPSLSYNYAADIHALNEAIAFIENMDVIKCYVVNPKELELHMVEDAQGLRQHTRERLYKQAAEYLMEYAYGNFDGPTPIPSSMGGYDFRYDLELRVIKPYNPLYPTDPINADMERCSLGVWRPDEDQFGN